MIPTLFLFLVASLNLHHISAFSLTLRSQNKSEVGREEWLVQNNQVDWKANSTAIVVVDMWNRHWCQSATTRVGELAIPMNETLSAARELGFHIVFAPSEVTSFYKTSNARQRTVSLQNFPLPGYFPKYKNLPAFPLSTNSDGGCDVNDNIGNPWTRQIATLTINEQVDYIISAENGTQELYNIVKSKNIKHLLYLGVHENMCIMNRPFGIEQMIGHGFPSHNIAIVRELVDVMYTPYDAPYVSHVHGVQLMTEYIEKFWVNSISMYDILTPWYNKKRKK